MDTVQNYMDTDLETLLCFKMTFGVHTVSATLILFLLITLLNLLEFPLVLEE